MPEAEADPPQAQSPADEIPSFILSPANEIPSPYFTLPCQRNSLFAAGQCNPYSLAPAKPSVANVLLHGGEEIKR